MKFEEIRELKTNKEKFVKILKDLLHWERKYKNMNSHNLENYKIKKLISEMNPNKLYITFLKLDEHVYYVVVKYQSINGEISTSWIHEDDIYRERLLNFNDKNHISFNIDCLTDLYNIATPIYQDKGYKDVA